MNNINKHFDSHVLKKRANDINPNDANYFNEKLKIQNSLNDDFFDFTTTNNNCETMHSTTTQENINLNNTINNDLNMDINSNLNLNYTTNELKKNNTYYYPYNKNNKNNDVNHIYDTHQSERNIYHKNNMNNNNHIINNDNNYSALVNTKNFIYYPEQNFSQTIGKENQHIYYDTV